MRHASQSGEWRVVVEGRERRGKRKRESSWKFWARIFSLLLTATPHWLANQKVEPLHTYR